VLGSGHIGIWLGRREEKEIIAACGKHLEKISEIVGKFKVFIDAFCDGDTERAKALAKEIVDLEREADGIKEGIMDNLMESSFHPMDQDEIIRLVTTSDDIAAHIKSATRKMSYTHTEDIPESIKAELKELVNTLVEENAALTETVEALSRNRGSVTEKAEKTERLEEKVDDLRLNFVAHILKWGDRAPHVSDWLMIKEVAENIESASDKIEDTADVLRSIVILRGRR